MDDRAPSKKTNPNEANPLSTSPKIDPENTNPKSPPADATDPGNPTPKAGRPKKSSRRKKSNRGRNRQARPGRNLRADQGAAPSLEVIHEYLTTWVLRELRKRLPEGVDPPDNLELDVHLPIRISGVRPSVGKLRSALTDQVARLAEAIELEAIGYHRGRAMCFWCRRSDCQHSLPPTPRSILTGYRSTGEPIWLDFSTWVIDQRDERVDRLFEEYPTPLARYVDGRELTSELLAEFRAHRSVYVILAQVCAGYFRVPTQQTSVAAVAIVAQLIERRLPGGDTRYSLNIVVCPPAGMSFEVIVGEQRSRVLASWTRALRREIRRWDERLREERKRGRRPPLNDVREEARTMMRDAVPLLEKHLRQSGRRTQHAHNRSSDATRPTGSALSDARQAADEEFYRDRQQETIVIRGPRHRIHVFSETGTHVTSVSYSGSAIREKIRSRRWIPLEPDALIAFRERISTR